MNIEEKLSEIKMQRYKILPTKFTVSELLEIVSTFKSSKTNEYNVELLSDFVEYLDKNYK